MALSPMLEGKLRIPLIGAPMFIVSGPELVMAQCKAGIVGSFPALNARPESMLETWLQRITTELAEHAAAHPDEPVAPFAVNQIVHKSNDRLQHDVATCVKYKVPIIITSLRPPAEVVAAVHEYGGVVFHDVINLRHAEKAISQGVDGIIAVCAGAGGHAGTTSPFALTKEIRRMFDGTLILAGAMSRGCDLVSARALGADLAYFGTRFIASHEANAPDSYKQMIVASRAADIVYTPVFTGVHGSYLRGSIENAGLDPDKLSEKEMKSMDFGSGGNARAKAWRDIWGAGQGVGTIDAVASVRDIVAQLEREYRQTLQSLAPA
ncbi:MAG TPA: nitronate monooxygenase family protein [Woeseiaceae bacterium]|nr:nitronate monooxygenase family protein [Woeseiaceae bacterium]